MKQWLKVAVVCVLAVCMCASLFACGNGGNGLEESSEWKNNASVVSRNKELAHSPIVSYDSIEDALKADITASSRYLSLNGEWRFNLVTKESDVPEGFQNKDFDSESWNTVNVPGNWETQGYSAPDYAYSDYTWDTASLTPPELPEENEIGLYIRQIDVPADWDGKEIFISFDGVESACYVYVNGAMCGYGEDSYTSKDFRITSYIEPGKTNTIAVKVFKYCDASWLEAQDTLKMGGIYRDVYLYASEKTMIKDFSVNATVDIDAGTVGSGNALLYLSAGVASYSGRENGYYSEFSLYDADGNAVVEPFRFGADVSFSEDKTGGAYTADVSGRVTVNGVKLWSAETPYLYTAVYTLKNADGTTVGTVSERIGIRDAAFASDDSGKQIFTVNGEPVSLFGVTYYEFSAVNGKALTRDEMIEDIQKMKELNINAVRSPGVPLSYEFISLCNEYGLYVVSDINLETEPWSSKNEQSVPGDQGIWQPAILDRLSNVLKRDKNCPSVILWGLGNESGQGSVLTNIKNYLIENDSRLIVYDAYLDLEKEDYDNTDYISDGDIIAASGWDLDKLNDVLTNTSITKPVLIQNMDSALLSSGGGVSNIIDYITADNTVQGCFLANWTDKAIYVPKDAENAAKVCRETPYNEENADLYTLQYAASWIDSEDRMGSTVYSLNGILNADRSFQSDALEMKTSYAPIAVEPINVKEGTFRISDRFGFTDAGSDFTVSYSVSNGTVGVVDISSLKAGEFMDVKLDYGAVDASSDVFVTVTVKYANKPAWGRDGYDGTISSVQYDVTGNTAPVKNGGSTDVSGQALSLDMFRAPAITAVNTDLAKGIIYITNYGSEAFDDLFTMKYTVVETNNYCDLPKAVVYATGTVKTGVGAYTAEAKVKLPISVEAVREGSYEVIISVTTKRAFGDIPAGYEMLYNFNEANIGKIPFTIDESRTPVPVMDETTGEQAVDKLGNRIWVDGDPGLTEYTDSTVYYNEPIETNPIPDPYIKLSNDKVTIEIDPDLGYITKFTVDGKNVFEPANSESGANESAFCTFGRNLTGGDLTNTDVDALVYWTGVGNSSPVLRESIVSVKKIDAGHYRLSVRYEVPSVNGENVSSVQTLDSYYAVVYDFYANGVINISAAFDLNSEANSPTVLANVLTMSSDYKNVTWYGRGPGETYADKLYDSTVDVFSSDVDSMIPSNLFSTGGDRSQTRWLAMTDASGSGVVITSDTNNFAFNTAKVYPWETAYYGSAVSSRNFNVLSIIGAQTGCSNYGASDQAYVSDSYSIDPGTTHSFSFRIVPVNSANVDTYKAESARTLASAGKATVEKRSISGGETYSLKGLASGQYASISNNELSVLEGLGSAEQRFMIERTDSSGFYIKYTAKDLYMTATGLSTQYKPSIEIGFAPLDTEKYPWQMWYYSDNQLVCERLSLYSLSVMQYATFPGARVALSNVPSNDSSFWTINYDVGNSDYATLKNNNSGLYLTYIDSVSYSSAMIAALDNRTIGYAPDINWEEYHTQEDLEANAVNHAPTTGRITQCELLPADSQTWKFISEGDSDYRIQSTSTGFYLGVRTDSEGNSSLVLYDATNADEDPASLVWRIRDRGGVYSIINVDTELALQTTLKRVRLTQTEMDRDFITDPEVAFKSTYVLSLAEWSGKLNQKWDLASDSDRMLSITLGSDWYVNGIEEPK